WAPWRVRMAAAGTLLPGPHGDSSLGAVREQRPDELVERLAVAAGHRRLRQRTHRCSAGHVHGQRDLAEVVAGPQDTPRAERGLTDREHPGQDDVEAVAVLSFLDHGAAGRYLLTAHLLSEPDQRLAGELGEQADALQLR